MKNLKMFFTKNQVMGLLIATNLAAVAYISVTKTEIQPAPAKAARKTAKGTIEAPILKNDEKLQMCYHRYLETHPTIDEGMVKLHIMIKNTGEIDYLKLAESSIPDEAFTSCILEEVRGRRLEPTRERLGVLISHKFNFTKRTVSSLDY